MSTRRRSIGWVVAWLLAAASTHHTRVAASRAGESEPLTVHKVLNERRLEGKGVIVYMGQNGKHKSYGKLERGTQKDLLVASVDALFKNYNDRHKEDVIVFHTGDFNATDMEDVAKGRPEVQFHLLEDGGEWWSLPKNIPEESKSTWHYYTKGKKPYFSEGYRHMIMWYSSRIWKYLERAGYAWVMRMDDDSFLRSEVKHNIFERMRKGRFLYGFRQIACEAGTTPGFMAGPFTIF